MKKVMFVSSFIGEIGVAEEDGLITNLFFGGAFKPQNFVVEETPLLKNAVNQIKEYFSGKRKNFDLRIKLVGTDFQIKVWEAIRKIPYGQTITYKQLAKQIGDENSFRAVGLACGKNPILLIVPCHRVIAENGKLSGYAGGVLAKQKLLKFENENKS